MGAERTVMDAAERTPMTVNWDTLMWSEIYGHNPTPTSLLGPLSAPVAATLRTK